MSSTSSRPKRRASMPRGCNSNNNSNDNENPSSSSFSSDGPCVGANKRARSASSRSLSLNVNDRGGDNSNNTNSNSRASSASTATTTATTSTTCSAARSNIFDGAEQETTRTSSFSILAPATQFPPNNNNANNNSDSNNNNNNNNKSSSASSYSLFGAVMNNVGTTCGSTSLSSSSSGAASASASVPLSRPQEEHPSTPAKQQKYKQQQQYNNGISPGGFQLQDFVNDFGNSPFCFTKQQHQHQHQQHHQQQQISTPASSASNFSNASSTLSLDDATPRRTLQWHECDITITDSSDTSFLQLIDWSIQSALQFEYTPAAAAAAVSSCQTNSTIDTATVQQQAMRHFVSTNSQQHQPQQRQQQRGDSAKDRARAAAIDWEASLLYWQHPSTYPLPPHLLQRSSSLSSSSSSSVSSKPRKHRLAEKNRTSLSNNNNSRVAVGSLSQSSSTSSMPAPPIRKAAAPRRQQQQAFAVVGPSTNRRANGDTTSGNGNFLATRGREWREAFRSLYMTWMEQIRQLNQNNNKRIGDALVSNLYFYATTRGHTVLFRVGVEQRHNASDSSSPPQETSGTRLFVPEIVLSSSTLDLRDKLRSMGVHLMLLDSWHGIKGGAAFAEQDLVRSMQSLGGLAAASNKQQQQHNDDNDNGVGGGNHTTASPNIQAELVALRRAQAFGQNVGADVSVQVHPRGSNNTLPSRSPKRIPPLYMTGVDDCAAFFEV